MSEPIRSAVTPVGHRGAGVQILERRARSVTGWIGVVLVLASGYLVWRCASDAQGWLWLPLLIGIVVARSLVARTPDDAQGRERAGSQLRDEQAEGERR